jgi:hypothetical protein
MSGHLIGVSWLSHLRPGALGHGEARPPPSASRPFMSRARRLILAQVVVSAIALAVIYATLLTPGDDNPLFGVEAPNEVAPGDQADGKRTAEKAEKKAPGDAAGDAGGGGEGNAATETLEPGTLSREVTPPAFDPDTPVATQYRDTLSQLRGRLNSG